MPFVLILRAHSVDAIYHFTGSFVIAFVMLHRRASFRSLNEVIILPITTYSDSLSSYTVVLFPKHPLYQQSIASPEFI